MAATEAKKWRKNREEGVEITLPSGFTVRLRPIDVSAFAKVGYIPELLKPMLIEMLNEGKSEVKSVENYEQTVEWFKFLDSLCAFAFVSPRVQDDLYLENQLDDDQISVTDIDIADKLFIFRYFGRPANELASFRVEQESFISSVGTAKTNRDTNQQKVEDSGVGKENPWDARPLDSASG